MTVARMLNKVNPDWCGTCHAPPGLDCWSKGKTKRQVRRREAREWRREALADQVPVK